MSAVTGTPGATWNSPARRAGFRHHCRDPEFAVTRYDDGQRLRGRDHSSARMHHELLNDPVDWRRQNLRLGLAFGLDHVLGQARRLFFYFGQFVELSNSDSWPRIHTL